MKQSETKLAIGYKEMGDINLTLANEALAADSAALAQYEENLNRA